MESEAKYILVGAFVLISTILAAAGIFWISDLSEHRNVKYYTVYFKHQSLSGLQKDSWVTMKGIKVGSVAEYQISPRNIEEVNVLLRIDSDTPVKQDTSVVIKRNLLTGLATLDLVGSTQESRLLEAAPPGELYPVIPEGTSELDKIAGTIPDVLEQINKGLTRAVAVFSDENLRSIETTLRNFETFSAALAASSGRIDSTLTELQSTLKEMEQLSGTLKTFVRSLDGQLNGVSSEAVAALKALENTINQFDKKTGEMSFAVRSASQIFSQEVSAMSQSINQAAGSFSRTMESFEDPGRIISGPSEKALGPGETLRK